MTLEDLKNLKSSHLKSSPEHWTNQDENDSFWRTALVWKGSVTPRILLRVLAVGVYSFLIHWIVVRFFPHLTLAIAPFEYSGAVLGVLLVARMNAGMSRWWEARKLWGKIVNQSRNLAIVGTEYSDKQSPYAGEFLRWLAVWPHTMRALLRNEQSLPELEKLVGKDERNKVENALHGPLYVGSKVASLLKEMRGHGLDGFAFQRAETERSVLIDAIGACERIKTTPIPFVLAIKTRRFISLFLILLPLALIPEVGMAAPFITMLTAYPLFSLDQIGIELQNPFAKENLSHLPIGMICSKIEKQVLSLEPEEVEEPVCKVS